MSWKTCPVCKELFKRLRHDKQTCSPACKKALQRGGWKRKGQYTSINSGWAGVPRERWPRSAGICPVSGQVKLPTGKGDKTCLAHDQGEPRSIIAEVMKAWPHGSLASYKPERGPRQAGRINWLCRLGDELRRDLAHCYRTIEGASVPFETLTDVRVRAVADLVKES